jgi:hypothetical protein
MDEKKMSQEIEELRKQLDYFRNDGALRGYYALNRIVNMQVDYLNDFNLKTQIGTNAKDDKEYDRANKIWDGMEKLITSLNSLKTILNVSGDEVKDTEKKHVARVSPESIANVLGNTAGQQS